MADSDQQEHDSERNPPLSPPLRKISRKTKAANNESESTSDNSRTSGLKRADEVKTSNPKTSRKSKKSSSKDLQAEFDGKIKTLSDNVERQFNQLFGLLKGQNERSLARSDPSMSNLPDGERRSYESPRGEEQEDVGSDREHRPVLSLDPRLDENLGTPEISTNRDFDIRSEISLHVGRTEREKFVIRSDPESDDDPEEVSGNDKSNNSQNEHVEVHTQSEINHLNRKSDRFMRHVHVQQQSSDSKEKSSDKDCNNTNVLSKIFKDEISKKKSAGGLIIDEAQIEILESTWRSQNPDKISAYREEYRSYFPVHEDSLEFLNVPKLDDILEIMLKQTHGAKAVSNWDTTRQLYSQPFKQIEKLGFQGQFAARMNIISTLYIQQALGSLATYVDQGDVSQETLSNMIKDIFAMSTKSLDQAGRTGAFFHLIRRKATSEDTGLVKLKDMKSKSQYLPLTADGLYGKALEDSLEKRKERKEQLTELLPELNKKRKWEQPHNDSGRKTKTVKVTSEQGTKTYTSGNSKFSNNGFKFNKRSNDTRNKSASKSEGGKKDDKLVNKSTSKPSWGSFRIPRKNDS